ncbi:hypothetical protein HPSA_00655 [Helicobacter pylori SouthAfrica7]|uniref:Uncharacterized protein n=1 Tax=Helicobacter pylori (strain SouthAfrica7) TaxID=907239 RepID=E8QU57_HELPW|nr:hypothetical protein HPSA_00655 [Helicobacter pylori SouthAfrica7]
MKNDRLLTQAFYFDCNNTQKHFLNLITDTPLK